MTADFRPVLRAALLSLCCAAPAFAQSHGPAPERGTDGLTALRMDIVNTGELAISCNANLAHWYSLELGRVAHGMQLSAPLWVNPETAAVFVLNPIGDQMPVERLWCGVAGRSWETRFEMPLARTAGSQVIDLLYDCAAWPAGSMPEDAQELRCTVRP